MSNDLPDYQSQVVGAGLEANAVRSGLDADKPASPAAGDVWLARDTYKLYCCMVAGAWKDLGYWRADVTQSQPTRVLGTVYQNTGGKIRLVTVNCVNESGFACTFAAYTDASNPPTTEIAWVNGPVSIPQLGFAVSFIIKPGNYYKVDGSGGTTLFKWTEWDLF